ncbi:hypothetical protein BDK51DRAFT_34195 [Blyttiomyces helicus]|uniref:Mitochondrial ribosomal subunit S27-domain-containing protein n=1 Tax=Blyttiomyces helicus TaxID=388810 RepID=A0A4P9WI25_9FUNG|nr:hypothetical protein BDK51DRAFT_34195 [Blyttiomyces helicus]|eukprot:RKO92404.1 hypothetical protein BDK51DRAFT_34195 [Blyttiomyces helicus]
MPVGIPLPPPSAALAALRSLRSTLLQRPDPTLYGRVVPKSKRIEILTYNTPGVDPVKLANMDPQLKDYGIVNLRKIELRARKEALLARGKPVFMDGKMHGKVEGKTKKKKKK